MINGDDREEVFAEQLSHKVSHKRDAIGDIKLKLRNSIILIIIGALIGALISSAGFLAKEYIVEKNRQHQFVLSLQKQLFDKGVKSLTRLDNAYLDLVYVFGKNFALTTYELDPSYTKFKEAIQGYDNYLSELRQYGSDGQIQAAKNLRGWWWGAYREFELQYRIAEQVQTRVLQLLLIDDPKSDLFKGFNEALDSDLENLIQNENRVFYFIDRYKKPVIDSLEQHLYYQFRQGIGLEATKEMVQRINELPQLANKNNAFKWEDKKFPFVIAEGRSYYAPTLYFKGLDEFLKAKNASLKRDCKLKFIANVIEHDKELQKTLKKRKSVSAKNTSVRGR